SISLAGTSSGGNFDSINIDTTAVQTQIIDNDISSLSINDVMAYEDASVITFTVSMDKVAEEDVTFSYATSDTNTTVGSDYVAVSSIATIPASSTSVDINVSISNDTLAELVELFVMTISNPSSNAVIADGSAIGSIYDEAIVMVSEDYNISEDSNFSVNLLANDIVDGGMNIENFDIAGIGNFSAGFTPVSIDVNSTTIGQVYLNTNGTFMYETILANYNGLLPEITYYTDVNTSATLNLFVENDNNDAYPDTALANFNITIDMFANDESNIVSLTYAEATGGYLQSLDSNSTVVLGVIDGNVTNALGGDGAIIFTYNGNGVFNIESQDFSDSNITITYTTNTGSTSTAFIPLLQGGGQALP
ncbi:MAG: hypothetical protein OQJ77_02785, partial [Thiovulaceae bacterium]|nr:hypothetical protein [Sulfurimonadaceae bacterium]